MDHFRPISSRTSPKFQSTPSPICSMDLLLTELAVNASNLLCMMARGLQRSCMVLVLVLVLVLVREEEKSRAKRGVSTTNSDIGWMLSPSSPDFDALYASRQSCLVVTIASSSPVFPFRPIGLVICLVLSCSPGIPYLDLYSHRSTTYSPPM